MYDYFFLENFKGDPSKKIKIDTLDMEQKEDFEDENDLSE